VTITKWVVDQAHSGIDFSVKHMMISTVKGSFNNFEALIEANPEDLTTANIEFKIDIASIDTHNNDRDAHLRSADLFEIEKYPNIMFKTTKIVKTDDNEYDVIGDVSMHGITRPETFKATFEGQGKDPWGNEKVGFSAEGKLKRSDFGITYNAALETGGVLIGDQVKLSILIEASKEA
jgi:polyisoprenoid-binding protein YceI